MRTTIRTVARRAHWRWQRCGEGRSETKRVLVRGTDVTLFPDDAGQPNLLDAEAGAGAIRTNPRQASGKAGREPAEPGRTVLRSYWRSQPYGPGSSLRKVILVDVTR
jgi:hypothetical protein